MRTPGFERMKCMTHRADGVPCRWVPQLDGPSEKAILKVDNSKFRVSGIEWKEDQGVTKVEGVLGYSAQPQLCIADTEN